MIGMYFGMTIFLQLSRAALLFISFMYAISKPYHHSNRFRKYDKLMYFYIFFVSLICNDLIIFIFIINFICIYIYFTQLSPRCRLYDDLLVLYFDFNSKQLYKQSRLAPDIDKEL